MSSASHVGEVGSPLHTTIQGRRDSLAPESVRNAVEQRSVLEWLNAAGLRTVHLGLVDASGTVREKRLGVPAAARAFENGWSFIDAIQWWGPDDSVWRTGGASSGAASVDTDSGRAYPFADDAAFFLAEFGAPLRELSPRFQLQRMVELAASSGFGASAAWEFECIVLDSALDPSGSPTPVMPANRCWSALTMATEEEELGRLVGTLEAGAIPIDHVCAELGPGCLEIATAPEPTLQSADSAALAKVYTKAHFARAGRRATFMAQLGSGFPGLGGHPSLSLHELGDDTPLLCDEPGVLSKTGSSAVAGVVTLLPELLAMAAPYPNSFRRFGPGNWSPSTATWGSDAYSCALRVVTRQARDALASNCGYPAPTRARITVWPCFWAPPSGGSKSDSTRRRRSHLPQTDAPAGTAASPTTWWKPPSGSRPARPLESSSAPPSSSTSRRPDGPRRRPASVSSPPKSATATSIRSDRRKTGVGMVTW